MGNPKKKKSSLTQRVRKLERKVHRIERSIEILEVQNSSMRKDIEEMKVNWYSNTVKLKL